MTITKPRITHAEFTCSICKEPSKEQIPDTFKTTFGRAQYRILMKNKGICGDCFHAHA